MTAPLPRRPLAVFTDWERCDVPAEVAAVSSSIEAWQSGPLCVLSDLVEAEYPDGSGEIGPQWHLSVTGFGDQRVTDLGLERVRQAFGLQDAEEDNHHPGRARHLWIPVDPARRVGCECKETEDVLVEPDGYTWTNPNDGSPCRGCELAPLRGDPCPIHGASS